MITAVIAAIKQALLAQGVPEPILDKAVFSEPPNPALGDLAVAAFPFAAFWFCAPPEAAHKLAEIIRGSHNAIFEITVTGPYVNIKLQTAAIVHAATHFKPEKIRPRPAIMFEYSQPNTHKEYHIGHLRNACFGAALVALWRAAGQNIIPVTYNNDVGAHVAKTLWAYKKFHAGEKPPTEKGRWLAGMYVEATRALEENPDYKEEVSDVLRALEAHDPEWYKLWKETRGWSLDQFHAIYKKLDLKFKHTFNESAIKERGHAMVDDLLRRGIAKKSQGAIIMDFEEQNKGVLILRKSDGAGNYTTSDLALAEEKFRRFKLDSSLVVTDKRQSLYFEQLFMTLHAYGFKQHLKHLDYELVTLPEGAMSSRKGNVILFESLYEEVLAHAIAETTQRHADWSAKKVAKVAEALTIGAIKFTMVRASPLKVIVFDKTEALSFDGYTAPYLQYTVARINSIFKKAKLTRPRAAATFAWTDAERALWMLMARLPDVIERAATDDDPSHVARYCFELAKAFSSFYETHKVLDDDKTIRAARLLLVKSTQKTLQVGLKLLGLPVITEM